jgi:hypothetical protein
VVEGGVLPHFLESKGMARVACGEVTALWWLSHYAQWPSDFATIPVLSRKCGRWRYAIDSEGKWTASPQLFANNGGSLRRPSTMFPVYNKRKLPSYSLLRMGNSSSKGRPRSFVDSDFFYLFFYKTIRPD